MKKMRSLLPVFLILALAAGTLTASDRKDEEKIVHLPLYFSVLPGNPFGVRVSADIAVGLLMSDVYRLYGIQYAPIMSITEEDMNGLQLSHVGSITNGEVHGGQGSGVFNVANGEVHGLQGAGVFNVANEGVTWAQFSGVFNVSNGDVGLGQSAGVFNVAEGKVRGVQAAGVFNVANGGISGIQAAGVVNVAEDVNGVQMAGVVNVAKKVRGLQFGLVNISDEMYGLPIGLINIVRHGIFDFSFWAEDMGYSYVGVQKGTSNLYMLAYGGAKQSDWFRSADSLTAGIGVGMRLSLGSLFIDADVSAKHRVQGTSWQNKVVNSLNFVQGQTFPSLRLLGGLKLFGEAGVFAGATFDCSIPGISGSDPAFHTGASRIDGNIGGTDFSLYPKYFVGFKL